MFVKLDDLLSLLLEIGVEAFIGVDGGSASGTLASEMTGIGMAGDGTFSTSHALGVSVAIAPGCLGTCGTLFIVCSTFLPGSGLFRHCF